MLYVFLSLLLLLLILFYLMTINIKINFQMKNRNFELIICIKTLFGLVNFKMDIPYIKMKFDARKQGMEFKTELERTKGKMDYINKKKKVSMEELKNTLNKSQIFFEKYKIPLQYFFNKLRIKKIYFYTDYDLDDAAITGILAGVLYTLQSNILFWIEKYKKIYDCRLKINPLFQQENTINIDFSCIIQFKLGHIINGGMRSLIILYKRR